MVKKQEKARSERRETGRKKPSRELIVLTKETNARLFGRAYHALTETNPRSKEDRLGSEIKGPDEHLRSERGGFPKNELAIQIFESQHRSRAAGEQ